MVDTSIKLKEVLLLCQTKIIKTINQIQTAIIKTTITIIINSCIFNKKSLILRGFLFFILNLHLLLLYNHSDIYSFDFKEKYMEKLVKLREKADKVIKWYK